MAGQSSQTQLGGSPTSIMAADGLWPNSQAGNAIDVGPHVAAMPSIDAELEGFRPHLAGSHEPLGRPSGLPGSDLAGTQLLLALAQANESRTMTST